MSSRKTATAKTVRRAKPAPRTVAPVAAKAAPVAAAKPVSTSAAAAAEQVAADIQRALKAGDHEVLTPELLQKLMTAACRLYSAQVEAGSQALPVGEVTPTDIMVTASGLMRAGNLAVFELGMWQSWTGR
jgi:curli biogenesis system outer membrane secretion channel CsgG